MSPSHYMRVLLLLCLALRVVSTKAQVSREITTTIAESEKFIVEKMRLDSIIGVSVGIIMDDSCIWSKGFGFADRDHLVSMTASTIINIGSVTKTFTALSVMQLNEKRQIDIDQPIINYLPQFKPSGQELTDVTIKSLITHSSGIQSDVLKNSDLASGRYTDVVGFANETRLLYPAGMVGLYSNVAYNILGNLIKQVSKEDYAAYVHHHIFEPLGMTNSGFAMDTLTGGTKLYRKGKEVPEYELRDIASGGIYSNIDDLAKYAKALLMSYGEDATSIIGQSSIRKMFSVQNNNVPIETNKKGLGWFIIKNDSCFAMYHAGSAGFAHANILLVPDKKFAVIIMTNTAEGGALTEDFCFSFLNKFGMKIDDLFPVPAVGCVTSEAKHFSSSKAVLQQHVGNYAQTFSIVHVTLVKDTLQILDGGVRYKLVPVAENEFEPINFSENDSEKKIADQRYCFKNIHGYHILFHIVGQNVIPLGYKLNKIDASTWKPKMGSYEQFGYQLVAGDTKFLGAKLFIEDGVLTLRLNTSGGEIAVPLNVISYNLAQTAGLSTSFGYTIRFAQDPHYYLIDFAGLTFRKKK